MAERSVLKRSVAIGQSLRLALAVMFAYLATGCADNSRPSRLKMTVVLYTDAGLRAGSVVLNTTITKVPEFLHPVQTRKARIKGQAVVILLPNGQRVFALLTNGISDDPNFFSALLWQYSVPEQSGAGNGRRLLDSRYWPLLAYFRDPAVPATIEQIPLSGGDVKGMKVRMRNVWIEQTNEPVTDNIFDVLPWLRTHKGTMNGSSMVGPQSFGDRIWLAQFRWGFKNPRDVG